MTKPSAPFLRALAAELGGTFLIVFIGCGSLAATLVGGLVLSPWAGAAVWGLAVALAINLAGPHSGAHLNPAVTAAFTLWRRFPPRHVLPYIAAQLLGGFLAAVLLLLLCNPAAAAFEQRHRLLRGTPGSEASAMIFADYFPNPGGHPLSAAPVLPLLHAFSLEVVGTAALLFTIFTLTDGRFPLGPRRIALLIGAAIALLILLLGPYTMACFNPARDIGPRLLSSLAGWGSVPFQANGSAWALVYLLAPLLGGLLGGGLHRLLPARALAAPSGTNLGP